MNILIINGNPNSKNQQFEQVLTSLQTAVSDTSRAVTIVVLRDKKIRQCLGCFDCWWKTPGLCIIKDDSDQIRSDIINADLVVFASPVIMGFTSGLLKTLQDRLIPLVLPYAELVNNEMRHRKRYDRYPKIGLLFQKSADTDDEDIAIISDIYEQLSFDLRTELSFVKSFDEPLKEICDAFDTV